MANYPIKNCTEIDSDFTGKNIISGQTMKLKNKTKNKNQNLLNKFKEKLSNLKKS